MSNVATTKRIAVYRAKHKNGTWVDGFYANRQDTVYCFKEDYERHPVVKYHYILQDCMTDWGLPNEFRCYEIDPDTLCQYTGQNDIDNNMIWENDCIGHKLNVVEFYNDGWCINGDSPLCLSSSRCKVVGNIFDDFELLKR